MKKFLCILAICMAFTWSLVEAKTLTIAGTADLQGVMTPSVQRLDIDGDGKKEKVKLGGITRLATVFARIKSENPDTLIFSSGDDLMGRYFHTFKGKAIFSLMSAAGYDCFAFGNHEFDHGPAELAEALGAAKFTTVCSDLKLTPSFEGKTVPWVLREINGTKVGIFSLMTETFPLVTSPGAVKLKAGNVQTAREMVKLFRSKGVDVIVALTHIGYKQDAALAKQVKGIDLIFGGHSHHYPKKMGHIGKTAIVNGGQQGALVVRVDLPLDENSHVIHEKVSMTYIPVETKLPEDAAVRKLLDSYRQHLPASVVLGVTKAPWDLTEKTLRKNESGVADMINDLLRRKFKVDIVLNNSGAFRGKAIYPAGKITDTMIGSVDEFRNSAYIMELDGETIRKILEHSAAQYGRGGWLQVSGIRYTVDLKKRLQKIDFEHEKIISPGHRVEAIEVLQDGRWQPLEPHRNYKVLSNAYMVLRGGDGYYWFRKSGKNPTNTFTTFYSVMAEELHATGELTPPRPDGRIKIIH